MKRALLLLVALTLPLAGCAGPGDDQDEEPVAPDGETPTPEEDTPPPDNERGANPKNPPDDRNGTDPTTPPQNGDDETTPE